MPKNLPKGWVRTTLGEVCAINPRLGFDEPPSQVRTLGSVRRGHTPFIENDVIFAKITPCMENGKIAVANGLKNGLGYGSTEFFV